VGREYQAGQGKEDLAQALRVWVCGEREGSSAVLQDVCIKVLVLKLRCGSGRR
jgi:hypothetical protein